MLLTVHMKTLIFADQGVGGCTVRHPELAMLFQYTKSHFTSKFYGEAGFYYALLYKKTLFHTGTFLAGVLHNTKKNIGFHIEATCWN